MDAKAKKGKPTEGADRDHLLKLARLASGPSDENVTAKYLRKIAMADTHAIRLDALHTLVHQCVNVMTLAARGGKMSCEFTVPPVLGGYPPFYEDIGAYVMHLAADVKGRGCAVRIVKNTLHISWELVVQKPPAIVWPPLKI